MTRTSQKGNAIIEMTLVGIPIMFVLISIFEISRGMWAYHTLAHAVREGTRFSIVRGENCAPPRTCGTSVAKVAAIVRHHGVGLTSPDLVIELRAGTDFHRCDGTNNYCADVADTFPASPNNVVGRPVTITAVYQFRTALAMLWPGAGSVEFAEINFPASSTELIQF